MKNFTTGLLHNNHHLELSFHSIPSISGAHFFVTAITQYEDTISFNMKMDMHGDWTVVSPVPVWIKLLELQFNQLLKEQSKYKMNFN